MWLLQRAENHFGERFTRATLSALAIARQGWREIDLAAIVPTLAGRTWDGARFGGLRRLFEGSLEPHGKETRWTLVANELRACISARYLSQDVDRVAADRVAAAHLGTQLHPEPNLAGELTWHLLGTRDGKLSSGISRNWEAPWPSIMRRCTRCMAGRPRANRSRTMSQRTSRVSKRDCTKPLRPWRRAFFAPPPMRRCSPEWQQRRTSFLERALALGLLLGRVDSLLMEQGRMLDSDEREAAIRWCLQLDRALESSAEWRYERGTNLVHLHMLFLGRKDPRCSPRQLELAIALIESNAPPETATLGVRRDFSS